jgi:hypothetical protein
VNVKDDATDDRMVNLSVVASVQPNVNATVSLAAMATSYARALPSAALAPVIRAKTR